LWLVILTIDANGQETRILTHKPPNPWLLVPGIHDDMFNTRSAIGEPVSGFVVEAVRSCEGDHAVVDESVTPFE
jgi:hypothetical protein